VRVAQVLLRSKCALSSNSDCMGRTALWYARAVDQMAPVTASLDAVLVAPGVRELLESFLALVGCQGRLASAAPCFRT
jgi:hypothetical protein